MTQELSLFGLRFDSDVELNPSSAELRSFLAAVKAGSEATEGSDLARYHALLEEVQAYQRAPGAATQDPRERTFYAVIVHTQFANAGLELAVGQYKYHLSALRSLDARKTAAFMRSVEAELNRLNPRRKEEAEKRGRLLKLLEERKQEIETQQRQARAIPEELGRIARYVRDNLAGVEDLCRPPLAVLRDPAVVHQAEQVMIDGIKERVKEQLKDSLHLGTISRGDLEMARKDVETLAAEASSLVRKDVSAVVALLGAVHDHVKQHVSAIDSLMPALRSPADGGVPSGTEPFVRLEAVLVSLVSGYRFELGAAPLRGGTSYGQALDEARKDLFGHIMTLLTHDRRVGRDRRADGDRRRNGEPHVQFTERRSGADRRSGKSRRSDQGDR